MRKLTKASPPLLYSFVAEKVGVTFRFSGFLSGLLNYHKSIT